MHNGNISSYDNVCSQNLQCSQEVIECVLNDVLAAIEVAVPVRYCPFCIASFSDKNKLKSHLLNIHSEFLWELTTRSVSLNLCSLCCGKFAGNQLVAKHALYTHGNVLVDAFFTKIGSFAKCRFCQTLCESKLMTIHLESHSLEFHEWYMTKFPETSGGLIGLVEGVNNLTGSQSILPIDTLQQRLENLSVVSSQPKSILKSVKSPAKLPVRRVLTFSEDKENQAGTPEPRCKKKKKSASSPNCWSSVLGNCAFRCGKCSLTFTGCNKLMQHVKIEHKRPLFYPIFQCSFCNAKFYKCSYLEKHCAMHTAVKSQSGMR